MMYTYLATNDNSIEKQVLNKEYFILFTLKSLFYILFHWYLIAQDDSSAWFMAMQLFSVRQNVGK